MSVGFAEPRNPDHIPEHNLWTLTKNGKTAEARVRQVPFGIELRIYHNGSFLRSEVSRDGRTAGELAEEAKQAWVASRWVEHRTDSDQTATAAPRRSRRSRRSVSVTRKLVGSIASIERTVPCRSSLKPSHARTTAAPEPCVCAPGLIRHSKEPVRAINNARSSTTAAIRTTATRTSCGK